MGSLVSLMMSDIVDSTRRWNAAEGAMAVDLELHDRLVREVVEGAGGSVFKHTGDGMIAVFDDPVAAAGAAAGIQQAIGGAQWQHPDGLRVRAAVHTGVVYPRDGDLFGTAVNKVARLLGACPGGAVLVSGATTALLSDRAPEGFTLQPVGPITLAGFATPDDAHALVGGGLGAVHAVGADDEVRRRGRLPVIEAELVGRATELAAVWDALGRAPVVSLVGVGGMGKTRLALEVAGGAVTAYDGAVWWIDLANATTADAVVPVALAAVDGRETAGRSALAALCDRLAEVSGVVVVDNCEHVLAAARQMVGELVNSCPHLRVVTTSREALGLRREQIVPVGSLSASDGVALFVERALAVRPDLEVDANRAVIERLCARVDGIPLAIELAAARCRSMNPAEIDRRLGERFRLLRGGGDGVERHRTLQAAVEWSYSSLDTAERAVFDQMAVFAGGTLIDGLVAVTGFDEFDVLDIVDRLVARSMVVVVDTQLDSRYHQLETLRQFAEDRLVEAGTIDEVRNRHLAWAHALTAEIDRWSGTPRAADGFIRLCAEVDNLRVAVAHAVGIGRHHTAHEIVAASMDTALHRPLLEIFYWVQPIQLDNGWTDAAAICAAGSLMAGFLRGGAPGDETLGGVPKGLLSTNLKVLRLASAGSLLPRGEWQSVIELVDAMPVATPTDRVLLDFTWLNAQFHRQVRGGPAATINDAEREVIRRRVSSALEAVRSSGDPLLIGRLSMISAAALLRVSPREALVLADAALAIADQFGLGMARDTALSTRHLALGLVDDPAVDDALGRARELRAAIVRAVEEQNAGGAVLLAGSALTLIAASSPDDAMAIRSVMLRNIGSGARDDTFFDLGIPVPQDVSELEERTAHLSVLDALAMAVAALDRVIAETESSSGGDS